MVRRTAAVQSASFDAIQIFEIRVIYEVGLEVSSRRGHIRVTSVTGHSVVYEWTMRVPSGREIGTEKADWAYVLTRRRNGRYRDACHYARAPQLRGEAIVR